MAESIGAIQKYRKKIKKERRQDTVTLNSLDPPGQTGILGVCDKTAD